MSKHRKNKRRLAHITAVQGDGNQAKGSVQVQIVGMHCASCEVLIERRFRKIEGVESVKVSQATGRAVVQYAKRPSLAQLQESLAGTEYSVAQTAGQKAGPTSKNYAESGLVFLAVAAIYMILKWLDILPKGLSVTDTMSYPFIFAIGLVAAVSSCIAVTGGLLVSVSARYAEMHPNMAGWQKFKPQLSFNLGRVVGYTVFGGLVGAVGSVFTLSTRMTGVLTLGASLIMVILGCQLLNIFPGLQRLMPKMPKFLAHRVHEAGGSSESKAGPFLLGASTFFLPCGFTQALQLYVLSKGSFAVGVLTMLAFSLGTLPALLSLSALSSFLKGTAQRYFFRFAGVIVIMLGLANIKNGAVLAGIHLNASAMFSSGPGRSQSVQADLAPFTNGVQVLRMKVSGYSYEPAQFKVRKGMPVEWHIDGTGAAGCAGIVTAPSANITTQVAGKSDAVVTFTPNETGIISFSCPMGMTTRGAAIEVVEGESSSAAPTQSPASAAPSASPSADSANGQTGEVQRYTMYVTADQGFSPNHFKARANVPIELTVDVRTNLGGCMSTMVSSDYDIAQSLKMGTNMVRFTPTKAGIVSFTCPMGIPMGDFTITD